MTQQEALAILKTGANAFVSGEPGSGKTYIINQYISYLRNHNIEPAITASTGIAATHIGGLTIHSWSGIGIRRELSRYDIDNITQNRNITRRIISAKVLIIDEVSMLAAPFLTMLNTVCQKIKCDPKPFGGLQIILVGDFFQLPPISSSKETQKQNLFISEIANASNREESLFAYKSEAWSKLNPVICYIREQHRQEDSVFIDLLSAIRKKRVEERHKNILQARYMPKTQHKIIQLYARNADVDAINNKELDKIPGKEMVFKMRARGSKKIAAILKKGCLSPEILTLKINARVMFTKNDIVKRRYVNGTLGIVSGFSNKNNCPIIKTFAGKLIFAEIDEWHIQDNGRVIASIEQIPLRLAWALTIHKSQGMSLDAVYMDLSQTFEYGQGYVALSRARTLAGLSIGGINNLALEVHPEIYAKDAEFRKKSDLARKKLSLMPTKELIAKHNNFIQACGGKIAPIQKNAAPSVVPQITIKKEAPQKNSTYDITYAMLKKGMSFIEIANKRGLVEETIIGHTEKLIANKKIKPYRDLIHIKQSKDIEKIKEAFKTIRKKEKTMFLSPVYELLGGKYSYKDLRLTRLFI